MQGLNKKNALHLWHLAIYGPWYYIPDHCTFAEIWCTTSNSYVILNGLNVWCCHVCHQRRSEWCDSRRSFNQHTCCMSLNSSASNPRQAGLFSAIPLAGCCWALSQGEHSEPIWPLVPYTTPMYGWCQWVPAADEWKINALKLYSM